MKGQFTELLKFGINLKLSGPIEDKYYTQRLSHFIMSMPDYDADTEAMRGCSARTACPAPCRQAEPHGTARRTQRSVRQKARPAWCAARSAADRYDHSGDEYAGAGPRRPCRNRRMTSTADGVSRPGSRQACVRHRGAKGAGASSPTGLTWRSPCDLPTAGCGNSSTSSSAITVLPQAP